MLAAPLGGDSGSAGAQDRGASVVEVAVLEALSDRSGPCSRKSIGPSGNLWTNQWCPAVPTSPRYDAWQTFLVPFEIRSEATRAKTFPRGIGGPGQFDLGAAGPHRYHRPDRRHNPHIFPNRPVLSMSMVSIRPRTPAASPASKPLKLIASAETIRSRVLVAASCQLAGTIAGHIQAAAGALFQQEHSVRDDHPQLGGEMLLLATPRRLPVRGRTQACIWSTIRSPARSLPGAGISVGARWKSGAALRQLGSAWQAWR